MDPMTQSAQISSSQGFADGQNSAAKESKLSDKRVVPGSDKPPEGVATSLRFPSQPGSFSPSNYGSEAEQVDGQPDSPIKTSPVSERIKALEALAAKKREPDFRGDGSYIHFRDRHHEKSVPDTPKSIPEAPKSIPEAPKSIPEAPKLLPEAPKSLPEAPKSFPEAPKSLPEAPKPLTETPKSLSEAPKSLPDKNMSASKKTGGSSDQESPESPFEVLGDLRQVNEFEETEEWMKAHLPPVPDFDAVGLNKCGNNIPQKEADMDAPDSPAPFAGVPDAFMDSPVDALKVKDNVDEQKQAEEFDISFLPTAYVWDQQEKSGVQAPLILDSVISSSPAPPAGFGSSPPSSPPTSSDAKPNVSCEKKASWAGDAEAGEADSSGESDDTVIEDGIGAPASVPPPVLNDPIAAPDFPTEKEIPPPKSERKLMQVPTINVIETDEPNYSEEEMEMEPEAEDEDYEVVKDQTREQESENSKTEPPKPRPLETEFMEGYSPPSSPVDSDTEYSPKHKILQTVSETGLQQSPFKPEDLPDLGEAKDSTSELSQPDKPELNQVGDKPSPAVTGNEEVDFPDNDDEWSDEIQDVLVKPRKTDVPSEDSAASNQAKVDEKSSKETKDAFKETVPISITSFMQDEIYDRQSFDYDYDITLDHGDGKGLNNAKERFLSDPGQNDAAEDGIISLNGDEAFSKTIRQQSVEEYPQNPYSCFQTETLSSISEQEFIQKASSDIGDDVENDVLQSHKPGSEIQRDVDAESPDGVDSSSSEPTDSFVDFMRECLKSRQDEEPDNMRQVVPSKNELSKTSLPPSQPSPSMVMDLEQEKLTISALKELGSSQDEEDQPQASDQKQANPTSAATQSIPHPPCSQSNATYSKEVEAIDEWVAEAYHLAEHVLTAILTHLSVKDLIHWRDPKKSGLVFGLSMLLLLSLAAFSVISVASYLLLALLCVTITFRIYKSVVQAVQKSNDGHPFKALIDKDVSIPPETFRKHVDASLTYINRALKQMSRLFLVEDLVDSLKLAVVMWLLTYVGAVFNGITLLILANILLFAVPPVYEKNKTQIDQYIDLVRTQVNTTIAKLQEKLPGAVKRSKTE